MYEHHKGVPHKWGSPQNEWFKMEIHILPSGYLT